MPRELEGTLVLIGVVGIQLASIRTPLVAKLLPFYGPRQLIAVGANGEGPVAWPLLLTLGYGLGLLVLGADLVASRVSIVRHEELQPS